MSSICAITALAKTVLGYTLGVPVGGAWGLVKAAAKALPLVRNGTVDQVAISAAKKVLDNSEANLAQKASAFMFGHSYGAIGDSFVAASGSNIGTAIGNLWAKGTTWEGFKEHGQAVLNAGEVAVNNGGIGTTVALGTAAAATAVAVPLGTYGAITGAYDTSETAKGRPPGKNESTIHNACDTVSNVSLAASGIAIASGVGAPAGITMLIATTTYKLGSKVVDWFNYGGHWLNYPENAPAPLVGFLKSLHPGDPANRLEFV